MIWRYIKNVLIWIDQGINCVIFLGDPDETISSRCGKRYPMLARSIDTLFFWQKGHCKESVEPDEGSDAIIE